MGLQDSNMAFTFNSISQDGDYIVFTVTAAPKDWSAVVAVIEDFIERADDHLYSYAAVNDDQAKEVIDLIKPALNDNQTNIQMNNKHFHNIQMLIVAYESHGYGSLKSDLEAPITQQEWQKLRDDCETAAEELTKSVG